MNKITLLFTLLSFFFSMNMHAEYGLDACYTTTNIPDSNFEQALIDLGYDDVLDGSVLTANISFVPLLEVTNKNISDLTGIEDFTNLSILRCEGNQLVNIDVSQNTALYSLRCDNNQLLTLDVTQNPALEVLTCRSNQLTSLDFSQNSALRFVFCDDNQLTSIDVSQNTDLETLNVGNNQISSIDVSQNTQLIYLGFDSNQISSIDVSQNILLTRLFFGSNQLTSIDVTQNTALEILSFGNNQISNIDVSQNTGLLSLNIYNNLISSLDVSQNTLLTSLNFQDNEIPSIDVSHLTDLEFLYCRSNQITDLDLSQNVALTTLLCSNNFALTSLNVKNGNNTNVTFFLASSNPNLNCIEVDDAVYSTANWTNIDPTASFSTNCAANTYVPDDNFEQALIDLGYDDVLDNFVLTANINTITLLNLNNKNITDLTGIEDFTLLASFECKNNLLTSIDISQNTALTYINFTDNQLTRIDLTQNTALEVLAGQRNQLTSLDISNNTVLWNMSIAENQLTSLDLTQNTALELLSFGSNQIMSIDTSQNTLLSRINGGNNLLTSIDVSQNIALTSLFITQNQLTNIDISLNIALEELYIDFNQLTGLDVAQNPNLEILSCSNNQLTNLDVTQNPAIIYLYSHQNQLTNIDVTQNSNLRQLSCNENLISSLDVTQNLSLEALDIRENEITSIDVSQNSALIGLHCDSNNITNLDVSQNTALTNISCIDNQLISLNAKNGNNTNFTSFLATNNPDLICIEVDDAVYSTANWIDIDATTSFSESCNIANPNYLLVEDANVFLDSNSTISVALESSEITKGFQFDITFPNGFVFNPTDIENSNLPANFLTQASDLGNNTYRIISFSLSNETIPVGTTSILNFPIFVDANTTPGNYVLPIENVVIPDENNIDIATIPLEVGLISLLEFPIGDVNGDGLVNILDIVSTVDYILGNNPSSFNVALADVNSDGTVNILDVLTIQDIILNPVSNIVNTNTEANINTETNTSRTSLIGNNYLITTNQTTQSGTSIEIEVELSNEDIIKGAEFDFVMPTGFSFDPTTIIATARLNGFIVSSSEISPNNYKVIIFSLSNALISAGSGAIVRLPIVVDASVADGVYPIPYTNVILSDTNNMAIQTPAPSVGEITIQETLGIEDYATLEKSISIYPNPSSDKVFFKSVTNINKVEIFDINGKKVLKTISIDSGIDISKFSKGMYLIKVYANEDYIKTFKFIKD